MGEGNKFINILLMVAVSFFSAFAIGLNKYAIGLERKKKYGKLLIMSEILIHGISGLLIGLVFTKFISDIYILCALSGIGGMIGQKLLYVVAKNFISSVMMLDKERQEVLDEDMKYEDSEDKKKSR